MCPDSFTRAVHLFFPIRLPVWYATQRSAYVCLALLKHQTKVGSVGKDNCKSTSTIGYELEAKALCASNQYSEYSTTPILPLRAHEFIQHPLKVALNCSTGPSQGGREVQILSTCRSWWTSSLTKICLYLYPCWYRSLFCKQGINPYPFSWFFTYQPMAFSWESSLCCQGFNFSVAAKDHCLPVLCPLHLLFLKLQGGLCHCPQWESQVANLTISVPVVLHKV